MQSMGALINDSVGGRSLCDTRLSILSQELEEGVVVLE